LIALGVNIDHVATVRQARRTFEPDPVWAAASAIQGGADAVTIHLREDRRHIQDRDLALLRQTVPIKLNLEMAVAEEIVRIALRTRPDQVTLVPEKRQEVTTEGGLSVTGNIRRISEVARRMHRKGIQVSLFIDAAKAEIEAAALCGADSVEFHTGLYANARSEEAVLKTLADLRRATEEAHTRGLRVFAGHGLTYYNVGPVAAISHMEELNIGHSIISRAIFVGLERAVREMKDLIRRSCEESR
jgi:pyridoxine 5-phosphate synthase